MYTYRESIPESVLFKVILLGDSAVGKSSLLKRMLTGTFDSKSSVSTIGVSYGTYYVKNVPTNSKIKKLKLGVWDTAGNEKYKSLTNMYFHSVNSCVVIFDLTSVESFWSAIRYIKEYITLSDNENIYLIGNKCDLLEERKTPLDTLSVSEALQFDSKLKGVHISYHVCSVKSDILINYSPGISINSESFDSKIQTQGKVQDLFEEIGKCLINTYTLQEPTNVPPTIRIGDYSEVDRRSRCCGNF